MLSVKASNVISKSPKQLVLQPAAIDFLLQNLFSEVMEIAMLMCIVIKPGESFNFKYKLLNSISFLIS